MRTCIFQGLMILLILSLSGIAVAQDSSLVVYHDGNTSAFFFSDRPVIVYNGDLEAVTIRSDVSLGNFLLTEIEKITIEMVENSVPDGKVDELPLEFAVFPAFPNPFYSEGSVPVSLPEKGVLEISLSNIMGQKILTQSYQMEAGSHTIHLTLNNSDNLPFASGIYFLRTRYHDQVITSKLALLR